MADLQTSSQSFEGGQLSKVAGEVNFNNSSKLRKHLLDLLANKPAKLVIDLQGVSYMDSSGVATLVEALQAQRQRQAALVLCGLQPRVKGIFEIARLNAVFKIVDTVDAARTA
jgi:anti-sigma B factor antagonist